MNIFLLKNIRKIVWFLAVIWAVLTWLLYDYAKLAQVYAFSALFFLYLSLLVIPLYIVFPKLPYKALAIKARRATGVSSFCFAFLHANIGVFYLLGGISGVLALTGLLQLAYLAALLALFILLLMTATSFDCMVKRLGKYWKPLHRFVYLAAYLILFHATFFGSHFIAQTWQSYLVYSLAVILIAMEAQRFNLYLVKKQPSLLSYKYLIYLLILLILLLPIYLLV